MNSIQNIKDIDIAANYTDCYRTLMKKKVPAKTKILTAAIDALIEGLGDIEMNDVAKRAGVSVGLAYHYFRSKAGLVSAVVEKFYDDYDAIMNERYDAEIPWQKREYKRLCAVVDFLYTSPLAPIMLANLGSSPEVLAVEAKRTRATVELAKANIADGQRKGYLREDINREVAAGAIIGGITLATAQALSNPALLDKETLTAQLWDFIYSPLAKRN
ncbi:TetR/AcrR family transcriptional regulator [Kordiimonas laminariae]|uniref:TetR/AcrR family transcriptional regulator n=1 Tax=Kordiimonas laminariae TaxID=2917717 RepID=UPI001FF1EEB7|nr:TetR/AcrR family transcriptional regulator [Kordiimonas laminariae]MCK0071049.1 TetR/AcrR family transcriptional regulator [Kordiimonas laminariae]